MKTKLVYLITILISLFIGWNGRAVFNDLDTRVMTRADAAVSHEDWGDFIVYTEEATTTTYGTKNMLTGVAEIKPGEEIHPPHQHSAEEFLFIVEGEGTWSVEGKEFPAKAGDLFYSEPWDWHGITNTGDETLTFFVVKWDNKGVELPAKKE